MKLDYETFFLLIFCIVALKLPTKQWKISLRLWKIWPHYKGSTWKLHGKFFKYDKNLDL